MSTNYYKASSFFYNMNKFQGLEMIDPENSQDMINVIKANSCKHCFMFGHSHLICPKISSNLFCIHCQKYGHNRMTCPDYNKKYFDYMKSNVPPQNVNKPNPIQVDNIVQPTQNVYTPPNNNINSNNDNQLNDDNWNNLSDEEKKKQLDDEADNFKVV